LGESLCSGKCLESEDIKSLKFASVLGLLYSYGILTFSVSAVEKAYYLGFGVFVVDLCFVKEEGGMPFFGCSK
jgi:hypothetical protein